jgi:hypothetical protein
MNKSKYKALSNEERSSCKEVPLKQIKTVEYMIDPVNNFKKRLTPDLLEILEGLEYSQSRAADLDAGDVEKVKNDIKAVGQNFPVTVIDSGIFDEDLGGNILILIEGSHRHAAILKLNKEQE